VQQAQERWRSNNSSYAANAALATAHPAGLGLASNGVLPLPTEKGYYTVAISGESATGYTVTATAVTGTSQVKDTGCTALSMVVVNGNVDGSTGYTPPGCWSK
jgi:type IV pilus assembly protein PilE